MTFDLEQLTAGVVSSARLGAAYLREARRSFRPERVEMKHEHDYVSYVDRESERRLVEALHALLPEAGFITEEGTASFQNESYCWVIDPLDGTTNFLRDISPYCISIALRSRDELLLGVVYEVTRDECFSSWRGGGAFMNGEPIHVSSCTDPDQAYVTLDLPYNCQDFKSTGRHLYDALYGHVACIRMIGSAASSLCYVACGRYDIWCEAFLGRWDFSAGALILQNAGGRVTDFYGSDRFLDGHHVVATNGHFHTEMLRILSQQMPENM